MVKTRVVRLRWGRRPKRVRSNCVLCIPFILSGIPIEWWLHTCDACVITTWRLGLRTPLVARNYYYYYYYYYYFSCCCCCCCRWWYVLLGLLVLRPSISGLFQSATEQSFWATNREDGFQAFQLPQIHLFIFGVGGGWSKNCQEIKRWGGCTNSAFANRGTLHNNFPFEAHLSATILWRSLHSPSLQGNFVKVILSLVKVGKKPLTCRFR